MSSDGEATAVTRVDTPRRDRELRDEPRSPVRLGHFQLLEVIGHGGMGTVYSAYDLHLDRKVAIKVLGGEAASSEHAVESKQRLLREAQAMAKLSHPNVVPVYEVGIDDDTVFIAMEYVAGLGLDQWLQQKRSWRAIVDVYVQAGRGLAAAHEVGIVHRDFKPGNVLVDDRGHARVTDFGIAQLDSSAPETPIARGSVGELVADTTPLTRRGALVGTPAYMSPEQFAAAAVDGRSDQFSFCVSLYEALFGKRPFPGRHLELEENVKLGRFDRPDPAAGVPGWVTAIVLRGLGVDPAARHPSMTALVEALAADPGRKRRRIAMLGLGTLAVATAAALIGRTFASDDELACGGSEARFAGIWDDSIAATIERGFAGTGVPYGRSSAAGVKGVLDRYRASWISMRTEACRATGRGEQSQHVLDLQVACLDRRLAEVRTLTTLLSTSTDAKSVEKSIDAASSLTALEGCADTAALLAPGNGLDTRHRELRDELDRLGAMKSLGRFEPIREPTRALVARLRAVDAPVLLAAALHLQGVVESRLGDLEASERALSEALRAASRSGNTDQMVAVAIALIDTLRDGGISKAREAMGVARVAQALVDDTHDPALAIRLLVTHAKSLSTLGRRAEALPLLRDAHARVGKAFGDDHPLAISVAATLASTLTFNGHHDEGLPLFDRTLATATQVLGPLHPMTLGIRLDQCRALGAGRGQGLAPPCFAAVLPDADRVIGPADRGMLMARAYYGVALESLGRDRQARDVFAEAYRHIPDDAWADHFYIAGDIARSLGRLELDAGDARNALEHCRRARDAMEKDHRGLDDDVCVGTAQLALADHAGALATFEAARDGLARADQPTVGAWRFGYARAVWGARHDARAARALAEQARSEVRLLSRPDVDAFLAQLPH